jgi:predicted regulator of Ras-like GTPase activity (Roadblock/LC7/MglB family)
MMNQFSILASTTDSVGPSIARRHATASGCTPLRTQRGCPGSCIAAPLLVLFIASLLVVAKDGLMITQPSILAATADNLWPNTAACCRAVRPTNTQLLLVLCATRLLVVVGDGLMMNQFSIFASIADSVGLSIARRHATASGCTPLRTQRGCPGPRIAALLPVRFIAGLLVVAKDGLMITQPSILAATADNLWPNTAACCRAVRPGSSGVVRHYRCATASSRAAAPQSRASQLQVSRCATNTRHRGIKGRRTALTPRAFNGESRVERRSCRVAPRYRALQPPRPRGCRIANMRA